jgi:hypothetical protein
MKAVAIHRATLTIVLGVLIWADTVAWFRWYFGCSD